MTVMLSTTENVEQGFGIIKLDITASLLSKTRIFFKKEMQYSRGVSQTISTNCQPDEFTQHD
uniref:Uncharacterized protein n=1 Tax=Oryza rufipogon TaxID=4529 RepID=A0A0E0QZH7_ORYRU